MRVGIVGAGKMGSALAGAMGAAGHCVRLSNSRGPDTIRAVADGAGARAVTLLEALQEVDIVVLAVPQRSVPSLPAELFADVPPGVIVVDAGNYYPGDPKDAITAIEDGMADSEWVSRQIERPVVKAFNTILSESLTTKGKPPWDAKRIALPVSGDDLDSVAVVIELIDTIGFIGIHAGTLEDSWRQQPGTPACCSDLEAADLLHALALADRSQAPHLLARILQGVTRLGAEFTSQDLIGINRAVHGL